VVNSKYYYVHYVIKQKELQVVTALELMGAAVNAMGDEI
jgi:hypothetical protein